MHNILYCTHICFTHYISVSCNSQNSRPTTNTCRSWMKIGNRSRHTYWISITQFHTSCVQKRQRKLGGITWETIPLTDRTWSKSQKWWAIGCSLWMRRKPLGCKLKRIRVRCGFITSPTEPPEVSAIHLAELKKTSVSSSSISFDCFLLLFFLLYLF